LKEYFKYLHYYKEGSGTEFYKNQICDDIYIFFKENNYEHHELTFDEIATLKRYYYEQDKVTRLEEHGRILKPHQRELAPRITDFYAESNIWQIIWACGLGKTTMAIIIVTLLECTKILVVVPSIALQIQFANELRKFTLNKTIVFVGGDNPINESKLLSLLNSKSNSNKQIWVISTYASCHILVKLRFQFDFLLCDEAHHAHYFPENERNDEQQRYYMVHRIDATKKLFMTATRTVSMKNSAIFGNIIDEKGIHWAIENKQITDFHVVVIEKCVDVEALFGDVKDKELFRSCYMVFKSMQLYPDITHVLIYTNTIKEAEFAQEYFSLIINNHSNNSSIRNVYNKALHVHNCNCLQDELEEFKQHKYGIISCVHIFQEGIDIPCLNAICVASPMKSNIRIIQSLLRANRLDPDNPCKVAYYILPFRDPEENWNETESDSFNVVKRIISELRHETNDAIEDKVTYIEYVKSVKTQRQDVTNNNSNDDYIISENGLHRLKLRLRHSKSLKSSCSEEQDEFNYIKSLNICLNIASKHQYLNDRQVKRKHIHYIENPEEYFRIKGVWTDWYDFLGIDTTHFLSTKEEWMRFCRDNHITNIKEYIDAYNTYSVLPREPGEFYSDFGNLADMLGKRSRRR
jgi:predicted helicase